MQKHKQNYFEFFFGVV